MQNSTTILGIIEMRLKGISYDDCRNRYGWQQHREPHHDSISGEGRPTGGSEADAG